VGLYRSSGHLQLFGDFRIVTALKQQFRYLLLSRSESNWFVDHYYTTPIFGIDCSGQHWAIAGGLAGGGTWL
jgi:hypothetical protein